MGSRVEILMTAFRRPQYFRKVLDSWEQVRGIKGVPITVFLEPSDRREQMLGIIRQAQEQGVLNIVVHENSQQLGVDVNIAKGAEAMFQWNKDLEYLIFAEDDLVVSTDALEYLLWCDSEFRNRKDVLIACAHTNDNPQGDADPGEVTLGQRFRCWIWSTWRDRWNDVLLPTWDWNISTAEYPGDQCDWAWNLDLRVIPRGGYRTVLPAASRSQNIGKWEGAHASPGLFAETLNPSFRAERDPVEYRVTRELEILPLGTRKYKKD